MSKTWQQASHIFNERAKEYDSWYDDSLLFDIELAAIRELLTGAPAPRIEFGIGPGRFAQRLNIDIGMDPAPKALQIARHRGIACIAGVGEQLPLAKHSIGTGCLFFTLCFLVDPLLVFKEIYRVVQKDGLLLVGLIPADSAWGNVLRKKKEQQHPYYRYADFRTVNQTLQFMEQSGFFLFQARSTLYQPPEALTDFELPQAGIDEQAGFCILAAKKRKIT